MPDNQGSQLYPASLLLLEQRRVQVSERQIGVVNCLLEQSNIGNACRTYFAQQPAIQTLREQPRLLRSATGITGHNMTCPLLPGTS